MEIKMIFQDNETKKTLKEEILNDAEITAFKYYILQPIWDYTIHAIKNKCRQRIDAAIEKKTNENPKKLTPEIKKLLIESLNLPERVDESIKPNLKND